jgi:4-amino-4-deoxy-L-arabinose transferase-like glycosyltransferase
MLPLIALLLASAAVAQVVLTYGVFNQTLDEPAHIAAGMEWLERGKYTLENLHPPMARVAVALGPFLGGLRLSGHGNLWEEGNQILYSREQYSRNLTLARLGISPFFLLGTTVVWVWSRTLCGATPAVLAVFLFTTLPPVLAHAGLATTDMPLAATVVGALLAFVYWLDRPTLLRSLLLGLAIGSAVLSKFSALVFLPFCGLALLACHWLAARNGKVSQGSPSPRRPRALAVSLATAFLLVWAGYRFSVHTLVNAAERPHPSIDHYVGADGPAHELAYWVAESIPLPAPELLSGVNELRKRNSAQNVSYFLGEVRSAGTWYFFPAVLLFKTPLPFLVLAGVGLVILIRNALLQGNWGPLAPAAAAVLLLLACFPSRINLGVRHVLPLYLLLAIVAGFGADWLWKRSGHRRVCRAAVLVLLLWQVIVSAKAHPDYLAYFNELAGSHPDRISVDSDLDWGQDLLRLASILRARRVDEVSLAYFGTADPGRHGLPRVLPLVPHQRTTGWIAISETALKMGRANPPFPPPNDGFSWLEAYEPVALAGRSIRLYYLPEKSYSLSEDRLTRVQAMSTDSPRQRRAGSKGPKEERGSRLRW